MDWIMIIGFIAAILTTGAFLPQAIKIIKTKKTEDISLIMYSILTAGVFLWLIYGILIKSLPVIVANGITFVFVLTILILKMKYN